MTEEEAKTKWCPFARIFPAGEFYQSTNGADLPSLTADDMRPLSRCIASACMAWRWGEDERGEILEEKAAVPGTYLPGPDWDFDLPRDAWVLRARIRHGHCGLAGKP